MKKNLSFLGWALLLALPFLFVACGDDDEDPIVNEPMSIVEIASGDAQFSTLVAALQQADLVSVLEGAGPFTVFAPTNAAFTAAGIDLATISDAALKEVLLYHVLGGAKITSGDLAEGQTYASTASTYGPAGTQLSILIEKSSAGAVVINGDSNVSTADVDATNGVIHIVQKVLSPLDIVGHASANSNFTTLVGALVAADGDLVTVLSGDGPFTVFAPLNSAFAAIQSTVDGLTTEQLTKVLTYHVAAGNVRSSVLTDGMEVTTVNTPETFTVNIDADGAVTLTDAGGGVSKVLLTDVQATNGVIHVLESVIIPGNL